MSADDFHHGGKIVCFRKAKEGRDAGRATGCRLQVVRTEQGKRPHAEERWGREKEKRTVRRDAKAPECRITDMEKHILIRVNPMGSTAPVAVLLALTCTFCVNVLLHLRLHACALSVFPGTLARYSPLQ